MLVVYRIQNSILFKIKYNPFFIDTLVIECCQIVGNNTAYRPLDRHLIICPRACVVFLFVGCLTLKN